MRWYVVLNKDSELAIANLIRMGFECYQPRMKVMGKRGLYEVRMFGGYMFVKFDIEDMGWKKIWNTRGVRCIICNDEDAPPPLPAGWVEQLIEKEMSGGLIEEVVREFLVGDEVVVTEGPFAGHSGKCVISSGKRVAILLHLLGGQNKVYFSCTSIEHKD